MIWFSSLWFPFNKAQNVNLVLTMKKVFKNLHDFWSNELLFTAISEHFYSFLLLSWQKQFLKPPKIKQNRTNNKKKRMRKTRFLYMSKTSLNYQCLSMYQTLTFQKCSFLRIFLSLNPNLFLTNFYGENIQIYWFIWFE